MDEGAEKTFRSPCFLSGDSTPVLREEADMQGAVPEQSKREKDNADIAVELRRRVAGPLRWGVPFLILSLPLGASLASMAFVMPGQSARLLGSLAGAFVVLIGIASFGLALFQRSRWQRSLALVAVADELGLSFQEKAKPQFYEGLEDLEMFRSASGIQAVNVLYGEIEGLRIAVMDCIVAAGEQGNAASFENTVFVLRNVPRRVPSFFLTPRDFLSRMLLGNTELVEVELPNLPKFNKRFLLQGEDEDAIVERFNESLIALCLAGENQNVEVRAPLLVVQQRGKRLPPARYRDFIKHCLRLAQTLGVSTEA